MAQSSRVYFAARKRNEVGKYLWEKLQAVLRDEARDHRAEMRNAFGHVYGRDVGSGITSGVTRGGERGELALLRINSATANGRARHAIISSTQLSWKSIAAEGTSDSAAGCLLAQDVLEHEWKGKGLGALCSQWLKLAGFFSEYFMLAEWDRFAGPPLLAMGDQLINQGDLVYHLIPPWDVPRDNSAKSWRACQWKFVCLYKNRFDEVRMYPKLPDGREGSEAEDAILQACDKMRTSYVTDGDAQRLGESELIAEWHFFHEPSASLPLGRHVIMLGSELVLLDEATRGPEATYEEVPLYRLADEEMVDSPHAWTPFWDTLGAQESADAIDTAVLTRATTLSNPIIAMAKGTDFQPELLGNGWRSWVHPPGASPPAEVEFRPVQKEMLEYRKDLQTQQRTTLGLNDVALGQPQSAQMNAQAFAVLASMAVQQSSPFQQAWTTAVSRLGTGALKTLAKKVVRPRQVRGIGGTSVKYTGQQLRGVDSVFVEIGNPMEQTTAGRKVILDDKIGLGFITTPEQYDQVSSTGRMEAATRRTTAEMTLVMREREMLLRGELPAVDFWQNHQLHYRENSAAGLETDDANTKGVITKHLDEHYFALFGVDRPADPMGPLRERWLLGMQPGPGQEMPMGPPPGTAPPMPGAESGTPPPAPGEADAAMAPPDMAANGAADVPPTENPLTGAPFDPASGGLPQ